MQLLILVPCLLAAAAAAPQYASPAVDLTTATTSIQRSDLGGGASHTSHAKSIENAHSSVHRFDSRIHNPTTVLRRTVVQQPIVSHISHSVPHELFQMADGRIFALNTVGSQFVPGQFFQTADGRFFTVAVNNQQEEFSSASDAEEVEESEEEPEEEDVVDIDAFDVADAARNNAEQFQEDKENEEEEEMVQETRSDINEATPVYVQSTPLTSTRVIAASAPVVTTVQQHSAVPAVTHAVQHTNVPSTVIRTNSFASSPAIVRAAPTVVRTVAHPTPLVHATHAAPTVVRTVAHPTSLAHATHAAPLVHAAPAAAVRVAAHPASYSLADTVSRGFLVYNNAGVSYEF